MGWFYIIDIGTRKLALSDDGTPYPFNDRFLAKMLCEAGQGLVFITDALFAEWEGNGYTEPEDWAKQIPFCDALDPATRELNDLC